MVFLPQLHNSTTPQAASLNEVPSANFLAQVRYNAAAEADLAAWKEKPENARELERLFSRYNAIDYAKELVARLLYIKASIAGLEPETRQHFEKVAKRASYLFEEFDDYLSSDNNGPMWIALRNSSEVFLAEFGMNIEPLYELDLDFPR
jgi:hypothetical protein